MAGEVYPVPDECIRIISIDPSTQHMGISVIDVNLLRPELFKLLYVNTIHGEKLQHLTTDNYDDGGKVQSRMAGMGEGYRQLLKTYEPTVSICEDNFLGASPDTFKKLIEVVCILRQVTKEHGDGLYMSIVTPNAAKEIVKANFRGTKKEDVQKGILEYTRLDYNGYDINTLDEHSTDSIAIGLYLAEMIAGDRGVLPDGRKTGGESQITKH